MSDDPKILALLEQILATQRQALANQEQAIAQQRLAIERQSSHLRLYRVVVVVGALLIAALVCLCIAIAAPYLPWL